MAALPQLITVEAFRRLPEGEHECELHFGEVVAMTRLKHRHLNEQLQLFEWLKPMLASFGRVAIEVPYRPFREFDLRVAAVSRDRWDAIDPDDNLHGAPELLIEVKSPFNTERQLRELVFICLGKRRAGILDRGRRAQVCHNISPRRRSRGLQFWRQHFSGRVRLRRTPV